MLAVFLNMSRQVIRKMSWFCAIFMTKPEWETETDWQKWNSMCVLGGRRGFKMCSVVRQITLRDVLGSIINHQVHGFPKILPQNCKELIEISGVWIVYGRNCCPGEACQVSTPYRSGSSPGIYNRWLELASNSVALGLAQGGWVSLPH